MYSNLIYKHFIHEQLQEAISDPSHPTETSTAEASLLCSPATLRTHPSHSAHPSPSIPPTTTKLYGAANRDPAGPPCVLSRLHSPLDDRSRTWATRCLLRPRSGTAGLVWDRGSGEIQGSLAVFTDACNVRLWDFFKEKICVCGTSVKPFARSSSTSAAVGCLLCMVAAAAIVADM
jgi:hypothetical protein